MPATEPACAGGQGLRRAAAAAAAARVGPGQVWGGGGPLAPRVCQGFQHLERGLLLSPRCANGRPLSNTFLARAPCRESIKDRCRSCRGITLRELRLLGPTRSRVSRCSTHQQQGLGNWHVGSAECSGWARLERFSCKLVPVTWRSGRRLARHTLPGVCLALCCRDSRRSAIGTVVLRREERLTWQRFPAMGRTSPPRPCSPGWALPRCPSAAAAIV